MYRTISKHPSGAFNTENIFLSPRNPIQQKKWHSATSTAAGKLSKSPYSFATLPHDSCANNIFTVSHLHCHYKKKSPGLDSKKMILSYHLFFRARDGTRTRDPDLGKVVLHQLSHSRLSYILRPFP